MSPVFLKPEREHIRDLLLKTGYALFTTQGLKKTSLDDLTQPANIHKTSFYSFFESKEELYLELLSLERAGVEQRLAKALQEEDLPEVMLKRFLQALFDELETNPLVQRLVTHPEELEMIAMRVRPEDLGAKATALLPIRTFIERGQQAGQICNESSEVLVGVIRAMTMLTLHRKDIGETIYSQVIDLMVRLVATGLSTKAG